MFYHTKHGFGGTITWEIFFDASVDRFFLRCSPRAESVIVKSWIFGDSTARIYWFRCVWPVRGAIFLMRLAWRFLKMCPKSTPKPIFRAPKTVPAVGDPVLELPANNQPSRASPHASPSLLSADAGRMVTSGREIPEVFRFQNSPPSPHRSRYPSIYYATPCVKQTWNRLPIRTPRVQQLHIYS